MKIGNYVDRIPGATEYTPITQLGVRQSPSFAGLGTETANTGINPFGGILQTAQDIVSQNPLPTLALIAFLLLKGR